jgi:hypothetical protein
MPDVDLEIAGENGVFESVRGESPGLKWRKEVAFKGSDDRDSLLVARRVVPHKAHFQIRIFVSEAPCDGSSHEKCREVVREP